MLKWKRDVKAFQATELEVKEKQRKKEKNRYIPSP